jgi:hypothetical protein
MRDARSQTDNFPAAMFLVAASTALLAGCSPRAATQPDPSLAAQATLPADGDAVAVPQGTRSYWFAVVKAQELDGTTTRVLLSGAEGFSADPKFFDRPVAAITRDLLNPAFRARYRMYDPSIKGGLLRYLFSFDLTADSDRAPISFEQEDALSLRLTSVEELWLHGYESAENSTLRSWARLIRPGKVASADRVLDDFHNLPILSDVVELPGRERDRPAAAIERSLRAQLSALHPGSSGVVATVSQVLSCRELARRDGCTWKPQAAARSMDREVAAIPGPGQI